ncbi:MAG: NADPH-dependent 2,4-dienoyl-CoA reductase, partial [Bacteroidetes bacterium]
DLKGIDHPKVLSYIDVLKDQKPVGRSVAIIGAGGIGFDVAEYLSHEGESPALNVAAYMEEWGVDMQYAHRGGLTEPHPHPSPREIYLLQRSEGKLGAKLGKTTGWIHRNSLRKKQVNMMGGVRYGMVDDEGLHLLVDNKPVVLKVDNVVVCAGQEPLRELYDQLKDNGVSLHLIGGAEEAKELDAKRAIDQGARLAARI